MCSLGLTARREFVSPSLSCRKLKHSERTFVSAMSQLAVAAFLSHSPLGSWRNVVQNRARGSLSTSLYIRTCFTKARF